MNTEAEFMLYTVITGIISVFSLVLSLRFDLFVMYLFQSNIFALTDMHIKELFIMLKTFVFFGKQFPELWCSSGFSEIS